MSSHLCLERQKPPASGMQGSLKAQHLKVGHQQAQEMLAHTHTCMHTHMQILDLLMVQQQHEAAQSPCGHTRE